MSEKWLGVTRIIVQFGDDTEHVITGDIRCDYTVAIDNIGEAFGPPPKPDVAIAVPAATVTTQVSSNYDALRARLAAVEAERDEARAERDRLRPLARPVSLLVQLIDTTDAIEPGRKIELGPENIAILRDTLAAALDRASQKEGSDGKGRTAAGQQLPDRARDGAAGSS